MPSSLHPAPRHTPLLEWLTLAFILGVPNFLHFDSSGRTHARGLFNFTSLSSIALILLVAYLFATILLLSKRTLFPSRPNRAVGLWTALLIALTLSSIFQPKSRLTPPQPTDLPMSLFRIGTWIVAVLLAIALSNRAPTEHASARIIRLIGRICWVWIAFVWLLLPILPHQVLDADQESADTYARLGGQLIHPSVLASLAIIAFFYACLFFRGSTAKTAGGLVALATLILARTRAEQATFLTLLVICAVILSRKPILRLAAVALALTLALAAVLSRDAILRYVARGQSAGNLASLDDRTIVWSAAFEAVRERPILGFGYIAGARNALRDHWRVQHWTPPHAHNEFVQALLAGGVIALILILAIYARALWTALRLVGSDRTNPQCIFFLLIFLQCTIKGCFGPLLTLEFSPLGGIFLLSFIATMSAATEASPAHRLLHVRPLLLIPIASS